MTSVDDLFRKPNLPSAKRKLEVPDAERAYKATKLSTNGSPNGAHANGASVEDEVDDVEAGPELPPDDDDDEGRFFGDSGLTKDTAEALDYIDQQDEAEVVEEKYDTAWLRRTALAFEKKVNKNAELRARYENQPQKFMTSEADLDAEIKSLSALTEHTELYTEFAEIGSAKSLVELLAHENTDIAITAIEVIGELIDEDVQAEQQQWDALVNAMLDADLMGLLMSNLKRLDETEESDRSGVYHSLEVMEALASQQTVAEKIGTKELLQWLCERIRKKEKPLGQNTQYAAEVLQVLLQISPLLRKRLTNDLDGVDLFLQLLAAYRKRDPEKDSNEEEFFENIFDCLTCAVDEAEGKSKFVEAEGVELCLIMLKEGSMSKGRALRLLDHATTDSAEVCEKLVEAAGLKTVFSLFMKSKDNATTEHVLGIFAALLRQLPGASAARIRTLAKFTEKAYDKMTKLTTLRKEYAERLSKIDEAIRTEQAELSAEDREEMADEWFSRRLDGGLFCLRTVDVVLAWLCAEDGGARGKIAKGVGLETLVRSLEEQIQELEGGDEDEDTREMLGTLVDVLN